MNINTITITITPDELETIGAAIEQSLHNEAARIEKRQTFEILMEQEIDILRELMSVGYSAYIPGAEKLEGRLCYDVYALIDYLYREKDTTKEEDA